MRVFEDDAVVSMCREETVELLKELTLSRHENPHLTGLVSCNFENVVRSGQQIHRAFSQILINILGQISIDVLYLRA